MSTLALLFCSQAQADRVGFGHKLGAECDSISKNRMIDRSEMEGRDGDAGVDLLTPEHLCTIERYA